MAKPVDFSDADRQLMMNALDMAQKSAERGAKGAPSPAVRSGFEQLAAQYAALKGSVALTK